MSIFKQKKTEPVCEWSRIKIADALINEEIIYGNEHYYLMDVISGKHIVILVEKEGMYPRIRYASLEDPCLARRIVKNEKRD